MEGVAEMKSRNESARAETTEGIRSSAGREHEEDLRCCGLSESWVKTLEETKRDELAK